MRLNPNMVSKLSEGLVIVDAPWDDQSRYGKLSMLIHEAFPIFNEYSKKRKRLFYNYRFFTKKDHRNLDNKTSEPVGSVVKSNELSFNIKKKRIYNIDEFFLTLNNNTLVTASLELVDKFSNQLAPINNRILDLSKELEASNVNTGEIKRVLQKATTDGPFTSFVLGIDSNRFSPDNHYQLYEKREEGYYMLLSKSMADRELFFEEVNNLARYFNAKIIRDN